MKSCHKTFMGIIGLALLLALTAGPALAGDNPGLKGWEPDGEYNQLYKVSEGDEFKAEILEIKEVTPMAGMDPGLAMMVRDRDEYEVLVHLGPVSFVSDHGLKVGDKVKIRGAWAELDGQEIFIASKIKRGEDYSYKVRLTKDGTPFWTLTPEELAKERSGD